MLIFTSINLICCVLFNIYKYNLFYKKIVRVSPMNATRYSLDGLIFKFIFMQFLFAIGRLFDNFHLSLYSISCYVIYYFTI